jgi:hypothetical protein
VALYEQLGHERAVDLYLILGEYNNAVRVAQHLELTSSWAISISGAARSRRRSSNTSLPADRSGSSARLYIRVGRKADAIRMLDRLKGEDPWILAELYIHAGGGDRAVAILREMEPSEFDARRVEMILQAGDLRTQADLYRLLWSAIRRT